MVESSVTRRALLAGTAASGFAIGSRRGLADDTAPIDVPDINAIVVENDERISNPLGAKRGTAYGRRRRRRRECRVPRHRYPQAQTADRIEDLLA